ERIDYIPGRIDPFDAGLLVRSHADLTPLIAKNVEFERELRTNVATERRIDDLERTPRAVPKLDFIAPVAGDDVLNRIEERNAGSCGLGTKGSRQLTGPVREDRHLRGIGLEKDSLTKRVLV